MRLFLIGYMCSGKTTLGKYLAKQLNMDFIDLDEFIEQKENLTITDIFNERGEKLFRQLEHNYLKELSMYDNVIIATGGGTPCCNNNMDIINSQGISVYLYTSEDVLIDRLLVMGENRPLVRGKSRDELNKFVTFHIKDREPYYQQAKVIVNGDVWDIENIAERILKQIDSI